MSLSELITASFFQGDILNLIWCETLQILINLFSQKGPLSVNVPLLKFFTSLLPKFHPHRPVLVSSIMDEETGGKPIMAKPSPSLFRYNSPLVQVILIGLVCFCCPGMYSALAGMGGGGQVDPTAANNANTALYTTFAVFGVLGGGIYNILGPRATLFAGCSTYVLYAGSFLYYNHYQHQSFAIVAGAFLGVGAGLLWAGQGAMMTSYPPPDRKGIYISLFWSIFNLGGVIGGLIPFILNYNRGENAASVNDGTYIGFMVFMSIGIFCFLDLVINSLKKRNAMLIVTTYTFWGASLLRARVTDHLGL